MSALLRHALLRHQVGSLAATAVDFLVMIACVSAFGLAPGAGTAVGAASGGVTNFILGRRWIFRALEGRASSQALRYALVSAASLLLNAVGEHVLVTTTHLQFVVARVIVSLLVSVLWNFPMQRSFVFRTSALARVTS